MNYTIVTGISGAGKSTVLNALEDLGYHCIDNMPLGLIPSLLPVMEGNSAIQKVAIGLDSRSAFSFAQFEKAAEEIKRTENDLKIIFVDCPDEIILRRYKETRRRHPLTVTNNLSLSDAIAEDRKLMSDFKEAADAIIDTAGLSSAQLKQRVVAYAAESEKGMAVTVMSFGFKYGIPVDADLVFDVRCFPNPYYIESMKHHTGLEDEVYNYVFSFDEVNEFMEGLYSMISMLMPLYKREGKTQLSIAIGCTGGKHRSVSIARTLAARLNADKLNCVEIHRDIKR